MGIKDFIEHATLYKRRVGSSIMELPPPAEVQAAMAKIQHWMLAKSCLEDELRSLIQRLQPGRALNYDVPARPEREHPPLGGIGT